MQLAVMNQLTAVVVVALDVTAAVHMNIFCTFELCAGISGNSLNESSLDGQCGDCQDVDPPWSQCEPHKQGNCTPC